MVSSVSGFYLNNPDPSLFYLERQVTTHCFNGEKFPIHLLIPKEESITLTDWKTVRTPGHQTVYWKISFTDCRPHALFLEVRSAIDGDTASIVTEGEIPESVLIDHRAQSGERRVRRQHEPQPVRPSRRPPAH